ncbi:MAG TPA: glucose-1-phosphate thymidylyltransferase [Micromonosporaceae bacterium]|nr:glucose-1-phosphate thymidylyltransferase [Micromonosporaceae bacterium]
MKGLVLSGGMGTRLRPFSHSMPKQLVPVANKPVLVHCLENLREAGVTEVCVIVGDRGDDIRSAVAARDDLGLTLTYVHQPVPLGLAHCVTLARDFLGDDDFVMYLGDNVLVGGITGLAETFRQYRPAAQLALTKVHNPEEYGVAELNVDGGVVRLVEKPAHPRSDLAVIGVYFFTPAIHTAIAHITPSWRNELEITDALQWLVENGAPVRGERFDGYWKDTGRVEDLLECNQHLLEATGGQIAGAVDTQSHLVGPVDLAEGARVVRSRIVGPVVIGADTVVEDSFIGPYTAVGAGCVVSQSGLEYSILLDGAGVRGISGVYGSLIGRSAEVGRGGVVAGRHHRLILGDHTRVEIAA